MTDRQKRIAEIERDAETAKKLKCVQDSGLLAVLLAAEIPYLLSELRALEAENERLRECAAVNQEDWAKSKIYAERIEAAMKEIREIVAKIDRASGEDGNSRVGQKRRIALDRIATLTEKDTQG